MRKEKSAVCKTQDTRKFSLADITINADPNETRDHYTALPLVATQCDCVDCKAYAELVANMDCTLFDWLKEIGVNLAKNVVSDPAGANATEHNGKIIWCTQLFEVIGTLVSGETYSEENGDHNISAYFQQKKPNVIWVDVKIELR
jgi:hypothetical protein